MRYYERKVSAVLLLSGGLDSTVLAYDLQRSRIPTTAITVNYGQKHRKEIDAAIEIASELKLKHQVVNVSASGIQMMHGSALTWNGPAIPEAHYEDPSQKDTVVPNRNMVMIALATSLAVQVGATRVYIGAHAGDAAIYNDCRREFLKKLGDSILLGNDWPVRLFWPFGEMTKTDIVKLGQELEVPFDKTWTCYKGRVEPCGKCGACVERDEAFLEVAKGQGRG